MYEQVPNILKLARQSNTSVIAFICMDYVMARSVVWAAEATNTPAVVMLFPEHVTVQKTTGLAGYASAVRELAEQVQVPIGLHLDHDYSLADITKAMDAGFQSVMMDGSGYTLEKNIRLTRQVVEAAHARGVAVEGEIGHVGVAAQADDRREDLLTRPEAAERFCRETGVDALAVSIGNAHGEYKQTPHLDFDRLSQIREATDTPLVLHGGSGIPDDQLLKAFSMGIRKFNLGTDYLRNYFRAVQDFALEYEDVFDPVKIIQMPEYVQAKLQPYVENRLRTLCRF